MRNRPTSRRTCPAPGCRGRSADGPVVAATRRGSIAGALDAAGSSSSRESAIKKLHDEAHARSALGPRDSYLRTWIRLHCAWFGGDEADVFPWTPVKNYAIAALFKAGKHRATLYCMSRANEKHIASVDGRLAD